ncbi:hypothetical protein NLG97_g3998 [Lecanicillium saksenae]|uniref:Uncharacterized protein n=1 Tax=Lecanicillium saksenae TaxID=468837 RepID=A0ACC1QWJ0_9HYPO|nr:hypothetical protein NLG97_g3998 [Lecanicillium saksenae]
MPSSLEQLPDELLLQIGELVDESDNALALVLVSHRFHAMFFRHLCALGERLWRCQGGALAWAACQDDLGAAERAIAAGANPGIVFYPRYKFLIKGDYEFVHRMERNYGRISFWNPGRENKPMPDDSEGYWDEEVPRQMTPLVMAIRHGNMEMIKLLVEAGADVTHEAPRVGYPPIAVAVREGRLDIVRFLVETGKIDLNARYEERNRTLLGIATRIKQTEVVEYLLPMINDPTELCPTSELPSALDLAMRCRRHQIARLLLADPRLAPEEIFLWDALINKVIGCGDLKMLEILWPHRVVQDLVLTEQDYWQAISEAKQKGRRSVAAWLVKYYKANKPSVGKVATDGEGANEGVAAEAEADDAGDVMASGGQPAAE